MAPPVAQGAVPRLDLASEIGRCTAVVIGSPDHVEVRISDLPRRDPWPVEGLSRGEPRFCAGRLAVLMEGGHQQVGLSLPRGGGGGDLFRLDRLDGQTLDDDRGLQLITRRKPKSTWTRLNRQRAADMEAQGADDRRWAPCR